MTPIHRAGRPRGAAPGLLLTLILTPLLLPAPGCGGPGAPDPASPAVAPDSEAGRRAIAEDQALRDRRRAEEARARSKFRGLPGEG